MTVWESIRPRSRIYFIITTKIFPLIDPIITKFRFGIRLPITEFGHIERGRSDGVMEKRLMMHELILPRTFKMLRSIHQIILGIV
ncbi:hypothetical protein RIR_jg28259.t1 [Rhizophagus irregularis DAOM 181602=DAOM 197198]|nr:hypothetical protein RIR_jg28259.t1 [Rhizophagus irregularis DAOM 181602=DAOM 197198]